jgi:nitroimidazol reductase NimA-like FMN-containing flavoprotein (pyridoxamine 5'-phosphate oxidase superfamily)
MPRLTDSEIQTFLDEPRHLLRIGTVDDSGYPRVVPTWFIRVDDDIVFTPRAPAAFLANIRRDRRVGLSIDEDALPYRKLTIQGDARVVHEPGQDDGWRDLYRRIAKRYIGDRAADDYVDSTIDQPRALIAVSLRSSITSSWRMPVANEPGTGIWARRYYADGTLMAGLADHGSPPGPA